nr:phosphoglucomutase [Sedimentibacter sp.]
MSYPQNIDTFVSKLNKKQDDSVYVIEEKISINEGKYEGILEHDNINNKTIKVYTGPKLTGEEVTNVIISIPTDTPWKRYIKLFADAEQVYITYETTGDMVEADDINNLQNSISATQIEIDTYKLAGHINGGTF